MGLGGNSSSPSLSTSCARASAWVWSELAPPPALGSGCVTPLSQKRKPRCSESLSDLLTGQWWSQGWNQLCGFGPASSPLGVCGVRNEDIGLNYFQCGASQA